MCTLRRQECSTSGAGALSEGSADNVSQVMCQEKAGMLQWYVKVWLEDTEVLKKDCGGT